MGALYGRVMNRFRRKSDARTRPTKPNTDAVVAAAAAAAVAGDANGLGNVDGSTTPAGEPPTVQLPDTDEFRTSLILVSPVVGRSSRSRFEWS